MPKSPAILAAEQKLADLEDCVLGALRVERAVLLEQLRLLDHEIEQLVRPVQDELDEARAQLEWVLTRWEREGGCSMRYCVHEDNKPTSRCWDSRAWLRIALKPPGDWWWTLDIRNRTEVNIKSIILDPRAKDPHAPKPTLEDMIRAADEALITHGFTLTDTPPSF